MEKREIVEIIEEMIPYFKETLEYSMTNPGAVGYGKGTPQYKLWELIKQYEAVNDKQ